MNNYEAIEKKSELIRTDNAALLKEFKVWLLNTDISKKTLNQHISNTDFYINDFLLYSEAIPANKGHVNIDHFLGFWFIRKAMWASNASIKQNATSLKKFYTFMLAKELIEDGDLAYLKSTIKDEMSEWLESLDRYYN